MTTLMSTGERPRLQAQSRSRAAFSLSARQAARGSVFFGSSAALAGSIVYAMQWPSFVSIGDLMILWIILGLWFVACVSMETSEDGPAAA